MITWLNNTSSIGSTTIILLRTFFVGFGFIVPALLFVKPNKMPEFKKMFVDTAIQVVRVAGLLYTVFWLLDAYNATSPKPAGEYFISAGPLFYLGQNFYIYWLTPLIFLLATQLLWVPAVKRNKFIIGLLALLILLNSFNVFSLLLSQAKITLPIVWGWPTHDNGMFAIAILLHLFMFFSIVFTLMLVSGKLKDLKKI
jgi:hypothetical protein